MELKFLHTYAKNLSKYVNGATCQIWCTLGVILKKKKKQWITFWAILTINLNYELWDQIAKNYTETESIFNQVPFFQKQKPVTGSVKDALLTHKI